MKWLVIFVVVAAIAVFGWITLRDMQSVNPRVAVSRAEVVAYGRFVSSPRSQIVVDEIWKKSGISEPVAVGTVIPFTVAQNSTDHFLVCFTRQLISRRLVPSAIFPVHGDGVGSPTVPLVELRALCVAMPRT